jgi:hypothetical protein
VALAARGSRKLNKDLEEKIADPEELAIVRRQARDVNIKSFLAAIPLTLMAFLLPMIR